jgi:hypothetical protein
MGGIKDRMYTNHCFSPKNVYTQQTVFSKLTLNMHHHSSGMTQNIS